MGTITANSLAAANAVGVKNEQFTVQAKNLTRKILLIGAFDPLKTSVVANEPMQVLSADQVGAEYGLGSQLHRLAISSFKGGKSIETWVAPQDETGTKASRDVVFTTAGVSAGTIALYIANEYVGITIASGTSQDDIATAVMNAVNADESLPVVATVATNTLTLTAKNSGTYGNELTVYTNLSQTDELPAGLTVAIANAYLTGGAGTPDIDLVLTELGTGDSANERHFTAISHGYGIDTQTLDKLSAYNGSGNDFTGCYNKLVGRPFRSLNGDTTSTLTALITFTDARLQDRTNGVLAIPTSASASYEISAQAMGVMESIANSVVAQNYIDLRLDGVHGGFKGLDWTSEYDNRDLAVHKGISPSLRKNGEITLQNVVSFYRPSSVSEESNGYRSMRNIVIIQNLLQNIRDNFAREKWQGNSIVADSSLISSFEDRMKTKDLDAVISDDLTLAKLWESKGMIFTADYTIEKLKEGGFVSIRASGNGFDNNIPVVLSGEGGLLNTTVLFDASLSSVLK